jgi:Mg2+ and Co2+ transporter CorA
MMERFTETQIVTYKWLENESEKYDNEIIHKATNEMTKSMEDLQKIVNSFHDILDEMRNSIKRMNKKQLEKCFTKFDKSFDRLQSNIFYRLFIQPMSGLKFEFLMRMFGEVRFETNTNLKANRVINEFQSYLEGCKEDMKVVIPLVQAAHDQLKTTANSQ